MSVFGMITTKGSAKYTGPALRSLLEFTPIGFDDRIVLIDNDRAYQPDLDVDHSKIEVIANSAPKGFAANANQLVDIALSDNSDLYLLNNDLIFTDGWIEPLRESINEIVSPLSNREVNYNVPSLFKCQTVMQLEDYKGKERELAELVKTHSDVAEGITKLLVVPFFCPRIPIEVLRNVGHFDEEFGLGGGEDYDYCLRAYLAGFSVCFANKSFILHFGGKSSYSGVESRSEQDSREIHFRTFFALKWGIPLTQILLLEAREIIKEGSELAQLITLGRHREVIELLRTPGDIKIHL